MSTKSEIYQRLSDALSDSFWQQLKKSLVGRELLAYGTEVILGSDRINESFLQSFDYENASFKELIQQGRAYNIPVSQTEPSYIRMKLNLPAGTAIKPFDITFTIGNITFTNIDYCSRDGVVTLYQGLVRNVYHGAYSNPAQYRIDVQDDWEVTTIVTDDVIQRYIDITDAAMIDSVYFYKVSGAGAPALINKFDPVVYGPTVEAFRLRTLYNGDIAVELGDGHWATDFVEGDNYQLTYLQLTNEPFSVEGGEFAVSGNVFQNNGVTYYEIISSGLGGQSLAYARSLYRHQILNNSVVYSAVDVREFVNAYSYIIDSSVTFENNSVMVYVKPDDENDQGPFDEIQSALVLKGAIFADYKVLAGSPIIFQFVIRGVDPASQDVVRTFLLDQFSYENMKYDDNVDSAVVSALIQSNFQITTLVRFNVTQPLLESVQFLPIEGTIQLVDTNNQNDVVAWDTSGKLYGRNNPYFLDFPGAFFMVNNNVMNFYSNTDGRVVGSQISNKIFSIVSWCERDLSTKLYDLFGGISLYSQNVKLKVISTNEYVFIYSFKQNDSGFNSILKVFPYEQFWNYPEQVYKDLSPVFSGSYEYSSSNDQLPSYDPGFEIEDYVPNLNYAEGVITWVHDYNGVLTLTYGYVNNYNTVAPYFSLPVSSGYSASQVLAVLRFGPDLGVFVDDSGTVKCLLVRSYMNPVGDASITPAVSVLSVTMPASGTVYKIYRGPYDGKIVLMVVNSGTVKFYRCDGFDYTGSTAAFTNPVEMVLGSDVPSTYGNGISVPFDGTTYTKLYHYITGVSDKFITIGIDASYQLGGSPTPANLSFAYDIENATWEQIDRQDSFYSVEEVGTVDYLNGNIDYTGVVPKNTINVSYESTTYKELSKSSYLKLNETTPVIWK